MAFEHAYQVVLSGSLRGQAIRNVFFYRDLTELAPTNSLASDLRMAFNEAFVPIAADQGVLDPMFSSEITYTSTEVTNLSNPTILDTALYSRSPAGLADLVSPFASLGFRTARVRTDIRRGQKRFAGVTDTMFVNGELAAGVLTQVNAIASLLEGDRIGVNDPLTSWRQIIIKRVKYTAPSGRTAYRLPENQSEYLFFDARPWEANLFMTTQNTRKIARGI